MRWVALSVLSLTLLLLLDLLTLYCEAIYRMPLADAVIPLFPLLLDCRAFGSPERLLIVLMLGVA